jgi:hypothetical protein
LNRFSHRCQNSGILASIWSNRQSNKPFDIQALFFYIAPHQEAFLYRLIIKRTKFPSKGHLSNGSGSRGLGFNLPYERTLELNMRRTGKDEALA